MAPDVLGIVRHRMSASPAKRMIFFRTSLHWIFLRRGQTILYLRLRNKNRLLLGAFDSLSPSGKISVQFRAKENHPLAVLGRHCDAFTLPSTRKKSPVEVSFCFQNKLTPQQNRRSTNLLPIQAASPPLGAKGLLGKYLRRQRRKRRCF